MTVRAMAEYLLAVKGLEIEPMVKAQPIERVRSAMVGGPHRRDTEHLGCCTWI